MRKVLMLAPTPFFSDRGCHIRIYEESRWLMRLGVKLRVVTYAAGGDPPGVEVSRAHSPIKYQKLEAGPSLRKPFADLALLRRVRRELREYKPDVIHCHLHEGAFLGLLAAAKIPVVLDYQGSLAAELHEHERLFRLWPLPLVMRGVESEINSRVDAILLNCGSLLKEVGVSARGKCRVVGDGVDTERFCPRPADPQLRSAAGLREGVPVIVYLGLLNRYQGVDVLLRCALKLKDRGVKFQMLVMGYPLGEYPGRAQKMGLAEIAKFTGRTDYFQAHRWLALGEVAVSPKIARSESNGKILNYLAQGLPLVCFDRAQDRELAGECAEYAALHPEDQDKSASCLAAALEKLLLDGPRRRELSVRGRERAMERFGWEAVARRIVSAYEELSA